MARPRKKRNPIEEMLNPKHLSCLCGAKARSTGQPCKRWAAIGSTRCKFHGGGRGSGRRTQHGKRSARHTRHARVMTALARFMHQLHGHERFK